jgi:hypothetical protein
MSVPFKVIITTIAFLQPHSPLIFGDLGEIRLSSNLVDGGVIMNKLGNATAKKVNSLTLRTNDDDPPLELS